MTQLTNSDAAKQYFDKYPRLREMNFQLPADKGGLNYAFGDGRGSYDSSLVTRSPLLVMPGIETFDPRLLDFLRYFVDEVNDKFSVDLDDDGFSQKGMFSSMDRLKTVGGYMPSNMSYVAVDNAAYREELKLKPGYLPHQRTIAENVWRIVFSEYEGSSIKIPHKSAGGPRRSLSDATWKADYLGYMIEPSRFDHMLSLIASKDAETLANQYEQLYMYLMQKRLQVDTPGKVRMAADLEYALSGGRKGKMFPVDKKVVIDGKEYSDFSACRARNVHAGPWAINCILQIIASGHMSSIFERFPSVFHTTTAEQIKSLIDGHYVTCSDVKEYDRSMSREAIEVPHLVGRNFWSPELMDMSQRLYFSPYYSKPLGLGEKGGRFILDPRNWSDEVVCGNRSGHAWTSLVAKVNKVIETLCVFHEIGLSVIGNELIYLKNEGPIKFINNGDDEVVYCKDKSLFERYKKARYAGGFGHYVVEEELGQGYSGYLLLRDKDSLTYTPVRKIHTSFEKMFVPERSIGSNFRKYWYIGFLERINSQDQTPLGPGIWEIFHRCWREKMDRHFGDFLASISAAADRSDLLFDSLSNIDKEVLDDPNKIYYKYLEKDISKEVFDKVTQKVPFEVYQHIVKMHYSGNVTLH